MRKYLIGLIIGLVLIIIASFFILKETNPIPSPTSRVLKVLEDKRSLINLPVYLAFEKGYFRDYKINFQLTTAKDGEVPMGILKEGKEYQLLLCGGEEMIYALQADNQVYKYIYNVAQGSGSYLLSRNFSSNFTPKDLHRKLIIGAPRGSLREMLLEHYLQANHLSPQRDVNIVQTLTSPDNTKVFLSSSGDFLLSEDPQGTMVSRKGQGAKQVPFSNQSFPLLYKGLITTSGFPKDEPKLLQGFTNALYQGQLIINYQPISEYLPLIKKYFPNNSNAELSQAISNYKKDRVWPINPTPNPQQFDNLTKLMASAGELRKPLIARDFLECFFINNTLKEIKKEELIPPKD